MIIFAYLHVGLYIYTQAYVSLSIYLRAHLIDEWRQQAGGLRLDSHSCWRMYGHPRCDSEPMGRMSWVACATWVRKAANTRCGSGGYDTMCHLHRPGARDAFGTGGHNLPPPIHGPPPRLECHIYIPPDVTEARTCHFPPVTPTRPAGTRLAETTRSTNAEGGTKRGRKCRKEEE